MKKQIVKGWAYPCVEEKPISQFYTYHEDLKHLLHLGLTSGKVFKKRKDLIEYCTRCDCGGNCKPIRVTVTVEPEVNDGSK